MKAVYMQSHMSKGKEKAIWKKKSDSILNSLFKESIQLHFNLNSYHSWVKMSLITLMYKVYLGASINQTPKFYKYFLQSLNFKLPFIQFNVEQNCHRFCKHTPHIDAHICLCPHISGFIDFENDSWLKSSQKMETQVLQPHWTEFC